MTAWIARLAERLRSRQTGSKHGLAWQQNYAGPALIAVFLAVLLTTAWHMTMAYRLPDYNKLESVAAEAEARQTELRRRATELERELASLETEVAIVRGANRQLMRSEDQRLANLANLQAEVDFYQRLAEAGSRQAGLAIHSVELIPGFSPRRWRFSVAVIQRLQRAETVSGTLGVQLEGLRGDQPMTLDWDQMKVAGEPDQLGFSFKYFAQLQGRILLPADFTPRQFTLILHPEDGSDTMRRSFPWQDITAAARPAS